MEEVPIGLVVVFIGLVKSVIIILHPIMLKQKMCGTHFFPQKSHQGSSSLKKCKNIEPLFMIFFNILRGEGVCELLELSCILYLN